MTKNHQSPPLNPLEDQTRRVLLVHRALLQGEAAPLLMEAAALALQMAEVEAWDRLMEVGLPMAVPGETAVVVRAAVIMAEAMRAAMRAAGVTEAVTADYSSRPPLPGGSSNPPSRR